MIGFNKTKEKYGWLGNMAAYPIQYNGVMWKTSEALFQAMRFDDEEIISQIRQEKSPMGAKMYAKKNKDMMIIAPMSDQDVENMSLCLSLKFEQHKELSKMLKATGSEIIYEDISSRKSKGNSLFWGAYLENGVLIGKNTLGRLLMKLRSSL